MMKKILITMTALAMLLSLGAAAQIPKTLNYQGVLTDGSEVAVPDGSYNLTFAIYDVPSGGTALWTEAQPVVVNKGIFSAILGLGTALDLDFGDTYYLGISVEGNPELAPRVLLTASAYAMSSRGVTGDSNLFPPDGDVGIGTMTPSFKLHVRGDGAVPARVDGNNGTWAGLYINALQATATPMIGYERQSILHAYTYLDYNDNWACRVGDNPVLTATADMRFGVGTSGPLEKLEVTGAIRIANTATNNAGTIRWTGSDFEGYDGADWKSLTGAGAEVLPPGTAGQTLRHNGSSWAAVSNLYNNGSYVGIGTTSPESKLHISGGMWDLDGTEGDFKIGDDTYRLKIGVATGGVGAGTAGIRAQGGTERLILGGGSSEVLFIESDGTVKIGSPTVNGGLDLYGTAGSLPMFAGGSTVFGGSLYFYDEAGNITSYISADSDGEGGNMGIYRDVGSTGIFLSGNYAGSNDSYLGIYGSSRSATFDVRLEGNSSVNLPTDAIGSTEILEEAGCASYVEGVASVSLDLTPVAIASRSIVAPSDGYILAIATCQGQTYHNNGTPSSAHFGVSDVANSFPGAQDVLYYVSSNMPTGWFDRVVTVHGLFPVSFGTHTFYFLGEENSNDFTAYDASLTLVFIPTAYGTTDVPGALVSNATEERSSTQSKAITAQDIAAERTECERLNEERIRRELDEMRARIDELENELERERQ
jgi:hypothetical protein